MAWTITNHRMALQGIEVTETAKTDGTQPAIGTVVEAYDPTYGAANFIFLKGVASTVPGDAVVYDTYGNTTTRTVAASRGTIAVAMSSNVANQFGWYQISGAALTNTAAGATAGAVLYVSATAGTLTSTSATGQKVDGAYALTATGTPVSGKVVVNLGIGGVAAGNS